MAWQANKRRLQKEKDLALSEKGLLLKKRRADVFKIIPGAVLTKKKKNVLFTGNKSIFLLFDIDKRHEM